MRRWLREGQMRKWMKLYLTAFGFLEMEALF